MQVREIKADFNLNYGAEPRSPGLHVSSVIRSIAEAVGILKREDQEEIDWTLEEYRLRCGDNGPLRFPEALYRVSLGLAWEEWIGRQKQDWNFHAIGELSHDGLAGTPDGLEFDDQGGIIHEVKLTWKSSRSHKESAAERLQFEWLWQAQTKAYCHMATHPSAPVRRAHLHVFWVNGNYQGSGPEFRSYELLFSDQELELNWKQIITTAQRMGLVVPRRNHPSGSKTGPFLVS